MAPTYAPVSTDEEAATQQKQTRTRLWVRVLWVVQAIIAVWGIIAIPLAITLVFSKFSGLLLVLALIILALDTWMCGYILAQVLQQLSGPRAKVTVRKEAYKAVMATWLFGWVSSDPEQYKPPIYEKFDQQQKDIYDGIMEKAWLIQILMLAVVIAAFYPPVWAAWRDRKAEKQEGKSGGVELQDHQVRLLGRESSDGRDGFIEPDAEDDRRKTRA